jgi:hypothetical protein
MARSRGQSLGTKSGFQSLPVRILGPQYYSHKEMNSDYDLNECGCEPFLS